MTLKGNCSINFSNNFRVVNLYHFQLCLQSFLDLQYSFLDACREDRKRSTESGVTEEPRKKLKTCEKEQSEPKGKDICAVIKTEPPAMEEKQKLAELADCVASTAEQHFENCDISLTFPETPPSFELDPGEQELL